MNRLENMEDAIEYGKWYSVYRLCQMERASCLGEDDVTGSIDSTTVTLSGAPHKKGDSSRRLWEDALQHEGACAVLTLCRSIEIHAHWG